MKKKLLSVLLVLTMCLTLLPVTALAVDEPVGITGGGTEESPYQIGTAEQLYAFAEWYKANAEALLDDDTNVYAELTANIDLNPGFTFTSEGFTGEGTPRTWTPIGFVAPRITSVLPYLGEFDGNGHTISGLYIKETSNTAAVAGLFGYFAGYLHDVKIENSYIFSKSACTGSLAGIIGGTIQNCDATAIVISDAQSDRLNGTGGIVGNLNGEDAGTLNCTFSGSVESRSNPYVGGIVGTNLCGYIADCVNNGTVSSTLDKIGGIVGFIQVPQLPNDSPVDGKSAVIERCINYGNVSGRNSSGGDYVGGIAGTSSWSDNSYTGAIRNCMNVGNISGSVAGGIIGYLEAATLVEDCLNTGTVTGTPIGGIAGAHITTCTIKGSYYQEAGDLSAVGRLGSADGGFVPTDDEKISDADAKATADQISSGEIAWKLNTKNGTAASSGIWSQDTNAPTFASATKKATCKVTFTFEDGSSVVSYTNSTGKVEIPAAAEGKALTYQNGAQTSIFTADTVVTSDIEVTVADKQPCTAPVFTNNTDTLTSADDKEAAFTLSAQPEDGTVFTVYSAETDGEVVGTATWSGTTLTVTLNSAITSDTTYYVSMVTPLTTESSRTAIIVKAYVAPSSGSSKTTYPVSTPDTVENGTVTVSPKSASKGSTVTITVKPDSGYQLDDLTVTDKNGDELKLTDKGNGKYTFTMPASKVEIKATFVKEVETSPFSDVSTSAYYYEAVKWAQEKGITGGIGNGLFGPNQPCTRAQIVTFLWRAAGSPEPKSMSSFSDVSADSYYAKAVAWAVENGITTGTGDGKFSPDATCTRAQSVTFLFRAIGKLVDSKTEFSDVLTDSYYANAVAWAVENGVTNGIGDGLFGPNNSCTRAQIVTFLYRAYQGK